MRTNLPGIWHLLLVPALLTACQEPLPLAPNVQSSPPTSVSVAGFAAPRVLMTEYKERVAKGEKFLLVDTRPAASFAVEHIAEAVNVTIETMPQALAGIPKDRSLLLYCTCDDEGLSLKTATALHDQHGYTSVQVLQGGLAAWKDAGYQTTGTAVGTSDK